jgi:hypothetical protein
LKVKRYLQATLLTIGAALTISVVAVTQPTPGAFAQAVPSPSASPVVVPAAAPAAPAVPAVPAAAPVASPVASPASTAPAPRAGGFPMELAWPMLAGGAAVAGAGAVLLRRGRR